MVATKSIVLPVMLKDEERKPDDIRHQLESSYINSRGREEIQRTTPPPERFVQKVTVEVAGYQKKDGDMSISKIRKYLKTSCKRMGCDGHCCIGTCIGTKQASGVLV